MSIRTISEAMITDSVVGFEVEISDEDGTTTMWEISCERCQFFSSGLDEQEAFDDANTHICPQDGEDE